LAVPPPKAAAVAVKVSGLPAQTTPVGKTLMLTVGDKGVLTSSVTVFDVAVFDVKQFPVAIIEHETMSPSESVEDEKLLPAPDCTLTPFTLNS
jgi:hypothetical protein